MLTDTTSKNKPLVKSPNLLEEYKKQPEGTIPLNEEPVIQPIGTDDLSVEKSSALPERESVSKEEESDASLESSAFIKKIFTFLVVLFGLTLISGGSLYAAVNVLGWVPPFDTDVFFFWEVLPPEQVLVEAFINVSDMKAGQTSARITLTFTDTFLAEHEDLKKQLGNADFENFELSLDGGYDFLTPQEGALDYILVHDSDDLSFSLAVKYLADTLYFNIPQADGGELGNFAKLIGNWYFLDFDKAAEYLPGGQDLESNAQEKAMVFTHLTPEDKVRIEESFIQNRVFYIAQGGNPKAVPGTAVYHYNIAINRQGFSVFMQDMKAFVEEKGKAVSPTFDEDLEEALQGISTMRLEVWIEKKAHYFRKVRLEYRCVTESKTCSTHGAIDLTINDINVPVSVEAPKDAKSVEEEIEEFLGALLGGGQGA